MSCVALFDGTPDEALAYAGPWLLDCTGDRDSHMASLQRLGDSVACATKCAHAQWLYRSGDTPREDSEAKPTDRALPRTGEPCRKCPPDLGMKVRRRHGVNWNAYAYQARVTGYDYDTEYCLWSDEWNWKGVAIEKPFDIEGFISAQCLLQETKGDYDQFIGDDGKSESWFGGFKKCPRSSSGRPLRFIPIHPRNSFGIFKRRIQENGCCPYCSDIA